MSDSYERGNWANKTEFLLSCIGYAIGFGNIWRFPYLCYRNGGGAFLIPYLFMLFFCGIPLFFMETSLGQFSSKSCVSVFEISPLFKGVGYATLLITYICLAYYLVILSYPIAFLGNCFSQTLPWINCTNPWNTADCIQITKGYHSNDDLSNASLIAPYTYSKWSTPAEEFFHYKILQISNGIENVGTIVWPLFTCTFIAWLVVYLCLSRGVKSIGKVVYFTATFPYVILFALLIRGLTLPGSWEGIRFYIYPQWSQLLNLQVWADAAAQIFYSLGPGWGGLINMASYNEFHNNNRKDSIFIPILNCGTSIFAGFVVFSVLGFMAHETGMSVSTVVAGGPGLAFVTYPEAIIMMPWPHLWAFLFFFMFFLLGIDTVFVCAEVILSCICDEIPIARKYKAVTTFIGCCSMFLCSMIFVTNGGMYIIQLLDWYCTSVPVILICISEVIAVTWIYGLEAFVADVEFMIKEKISFWWKLCWKYFTPSILVFISFTTIIYNTNVSYNGRLYPEWSTTLGWLLCCFSLIWIPIVAIFNVLQSKGNFKKRISLSLKPSKNWGPLKLEYRSQWLKATRTKSNSKESCKHYGSNGARNKPSL